jgi:hypothetical protein
MSNDPRRSTIDRERDREREHERERASSEFEGPSGGDGGGGDVKRRRLGSQSSRGKKPREQYSCVECFR